MLKRTKFSLEKACQRPNYHDNLKEIILTHSSESARSLGMSILAAVNDEREKALEHLEFLAQENPDVILIHERIAELCIDSDKYEKAVLHLEKITELQEHNLTARFWLCLIYQLLGRTQKAKNSFSYLKEYVYQVQVKIRN